MPTAWYYVGGFGALSWVFFRIFAKLALGKVQAPAVAAVGGLGLAFGIIAGGWARHTWISDVAGWLSRVSPVVTFVIFIGLLVYIVGYTVAAAIPDGWSPAVAASFGIAVTWIAIPSFLAHGALPGTWGHGITAAAGAVTDTLMQLTSGAWG